MKQTPKIPLLELLVGFATIGFLLLWILEFRRTHFQQSYWLLMLFTTCLFGYMVLRYRRIMTSKQRNDKHDFRPNKTNKPKR